MLPYMLNVNGWYYYRRRIPDYVKHLEHRNEIKISLKTKTKSEAIKKASVYNDHIEQYWKELIQSGQNDPELHQYKAAVQLAKAHGFAYKTATEISKAPIAEIVKRLQTNITNKHEAKGILGGGNEPQLMLSSCIEQYWTLTTDRLVNKTEHKIRKWKNPRSAAFKNFVIVVGNKPIKEISRTDVLAFKEWWRAKIATGHSPTTANKQLQQVKDIIRTVALRNEINIEVEVMFAETKFKHINRSRPPFEASYIQHTLLPKIKDLNERDRMVVYVMADTGARESEIFGLAEEDIQLDAEIPYVWIRPRQGHELKTHTSERKIPLVGTALYAFQQNPEGFSHKGNPDVFSNRANKYITEYKLKPSERHSIYSLRHSFKDRLRDVGAPEELIDGLMGHKKQGPQYGRGHKLETAQEWLIKIKFKVPPSE